MNRKIYIDRDFKCHASNPDDIYTTIETDFFDGKCDAFIEGYRYIPAGESWTRLDGVVFHGEMICPWKPYSILAAYQEQYERMLPEIQDMQTALETLEVTVDG